MGTVHTPRFFILGYEMCYIKGIKKSLSCLCFRSSLWGLNFSDSGDWTLYENINIRKDFHINWNKIFGFYSEWDCIEWLVSRIACMYFHYKGLKDRCKCQFCEETLCDRESSINFFIKLKYFTDNAIRIATAVSYLLKFLRLLPCKHFFSSSPILFLLKRNSP